MGEVRETLSRNKSKPKQELISKNGMGRRAVANKNVLKRERFSLKMMNNRDNTINPLKRRSGGVKEGSLIDNQKITPKETIMGKLSGGANDGSQKLSRIMKTNKTMVKK